MIAMKLAFRLAFSRARSQRWRQLSVTIGVFASCLLVFLCLGFQKASLDGMKKQEARGVVPAAGQQVMKYQVVPSFAKENYQFPIRWVEPLPGFENDPRVVPPGLSTLPAPGTAVLSPGLAAAGYTAKDFGFANSNAGRGPGGLIGSSGLETASEHLIYVRPAIGRTLEPKNVIFAGGWGFYQNPDSSGLRAMITNSSLINDTIPQLPSPRTTFLLVVVLGFFPAAFLLFGAARAMSPVRRERAQRLWELGISRKKVLALLALETLFLAALGIFWALIFWWSWLAKMRKFPLTETVLVDHGLALPAGLILLTAGLIAVFVAVAGSWGAISARAVTKSAKRASAWRASPLVAATLLLSFNGFLPFQANTRALLLRIGLILALISMPISLPGLVSWLAHKIKEPKDIALWLAARRLALKSTHLTRPAAMVGALVLISGTALGLAKATSDLDATEASNRPATPYALMEVYWESARSSDYGAVESSLADYILLPIAKSKRWYSYLQDCAKVDEIARLMTVKGCEQGQISAEFSRKFSALAQVRPFLGSPPQGTLNRALILRAEQSSETDVRQLLPQGLTTLLVSDLGQPTGTFPQLGWMLFLWVLGSTILLSAMLREVGDRSLLALADSTTLRGLPLFEREIQSVNKWILYLPLGLAVPIGYGLAMIFAKSSIDLQLSAINYGFVSLAAVVATTTALVIFWLVTRLSDKYDREIV